MPFLTGNLSKMGIKLLSPHSELIYVLTASGSGITWCESVTIHHKKKNYFGREIEGSSSLSQSLKYHATG